MRTQDGSKSSTLQDQPGPKPQLKEFLDGLDGTEKNATKNSKSPQNAKKASAIASSRLVGRYRLMEDSQASAGKIRPVETLN